MGIFNTFKLQCLWLDVYQKYMSSLFCCGEPKVPDGAKVAASVYCG